MSFCGRKEEVDFGAEAATAWAHRGVLASYSCLLAFAGVLIVKIGKVWEDARSIRVSKRGLTLRDLIVVLVLLIAVGWILLPTWPGGCREEARKAVCKSILYGSDGTIDDIPEKR